MTHLPDIINQNINNAGAKLAGGGEMKPFVPDELWDERMRLMSAQPIEAIDAWTKAAKMVSELKIQLATRDALIERLVEAGDKVIGYSIFEDVPGGAMEKWLNVLDEYRAMKGGEG